MTIYVVQKLTDRLVKIGYTKHENDQVYLRLKTLRTVLKSPLELLFTIPGTKDQEFTIHCCFRAFWVGNELFNPEILDQLTPEFLTQLLTDKSLQLERLQSQEAYNQAYRDSLPKPGTNSRKGVKGSTYSYRNPHHKGLLKK